MTIYQFGMLSKKTVTLDGNILSIKGVITNKIDLNIKNIHVAYIVTPSLSRNGTVYFSTDGKDTPNAIITKNGFMYTKKQLKEVQSLIKEAGIKAIYSDSQ
ncbi:hypothetical protein [Carnobacterium funditum]|uniref:hypothetical protein n=1 Tax=Carnobacterium funditum TaxID=2752 RepID=UPI00054E9FCD|nr:hypothetical protein [Carnobacterium funditum]